MSKIRRGGPCPLTNRQHSTAFTEARSEESPHGVATNSNPIVIASEAGLTSSDGKDRSMDVSAAAGTACRAPTEGLGCKLDWWEVLRFGRRRAFETFPTTEAARPVATQRRKCVLRICGLGRADPDLVVRA